VGEIELFRISIRFGIFRRLSKYGYVTKLDSSIIGASNNDNTTTSTTMKCDDDTTYTHMILRVGLNSNGARPLNTLDVNDGNSEATGVQLGSERKHSARPRQADVVACSSLDTAKRMACEFLRSAPRTNVTVAIMQASGWTRRGGDNPEAESSSSSLVKVAPVIANGTEYQWLVSEFEKSTAGSGVVLTDNGEFRNVSDVKMVRSTARGPMVCETQAQADALAQKLQSSTSAAVYVVSKVKARSDPVSNIISHRQDSTVPADNRHGYGWFVVKLLTRSGVPDVWGIGSSFSKTVRLASETNAERAYDVHVLRDLDRARGEAITMAGSPAAGYENVNLGYVYGRIAYIQTSDLASEVTATAITAPPHGGVPTTNSGINCQYLVHGIFAKSCPSLRSGAAATQERTIDGTLFRVLEPKDELRQPVVATSMEAAKTEALRLKRALPETATVLISKIKAHIPAAIDSDSGGIGGSPSKKRKAEMVSV
jgi:hypothetical protein